MSSRLYSLFIALVILVFIGCSTDPEIDWDRMEGHTLISGRLIYSPVSIDTSAAGDSVVYLYRQRIRVERLKSLVGFVFDPECDYRTGLSGAQVTVSDSDSTYPFMDRDDGYYVWERDSNFYRRGRWYRLEVILPDGNLATSEIYTPKIYLEEGADTIWIQPDSITSWSSEPWSRRPIAMEGPHYGHVIKYRYTPETLIENQEWMWDTWWVNGFPLISENLFRRFETTDSTLSIYTAVESPAWFRSKFVTITIPARLLRAEHNLDRELDKWTGDDDYWPIDNLEAVSNINGAYGIFTASGFILAPDCVMALKP